MKKTKNKKGFTLIELIITIAIVAILSTVMLPSLINYINTGQQVGRMNIARTLYLGAQNQLTEMFVTKNLKEFSEVFYNADGTLNNTDKVYDNITMPATENPANRDLVRFIIKPRGNTDVNNPVLRLLDDIVMDKSILNNAICIEYNIQTGVVLSVFYSEDATTFTYAGGANDLGNIQGTRLYVFAEQRSQGYYGTDNTGQLAPINAFDIVNIHDGAKKPLKENIGTEYKNVLYADFLIPKDAKTYTFEMVNESTKAVLYSAEIADLSTAKTSMADALASPIKDKNGKNQYIYKANIDEKIEVNGIDVTSSYARYIWVIDLVKGDTFSQEDKNYTVLNNFPDLEPQSIRANAKRNAVGENTYSLTFANSHYFEEGKKGLGVSYYSITSPRHLYNVRKAPTKQFIQTADIRMYDGANPLNTVSNFEPIPQFSGSYSGLKSTNNSQNIIYSLAIAPPTTYTFKDIGLFGTINGNTANVVGVALYNANIASASGGNVGSIAGVLNGGSIKQSNAFANVSVSGGTANIGGLVGEIKAGTLESCYNGGYFDATNRQFAQEDGTINNPLTGSVAASGNSHANVGGLVGLSAGNIKESYNNARVNIDSVIVGLPGTPEEYLSYLKTPSIDSYSNLTASTSNLGGIVGENSGTVDGTYATNFVGKNKTETSNTGGIVGNNTVNDLNIKNSYFLLNSLNPIGSSITTSATLMAVDKAELAAKIGGNFAKGMEYKQGVNLSVGTGAEAIYGYAYPVLRNNLHFTNWEDIKTQDTAIAEVQLRYYEIYNDGTTGLSPNLEPAFSTSKIADNDGYCLDFEYFSPVTLVIDSNEYVLKDTANNNENPKWQWDTVKNPNPKMKNLPIRVGTSSNGKPTYRLYLDTAVIEEIAKNSANGYIKIQLLQRGERKLEGSSGKVGVAGGTDVYFNPLFANEISKNIPERSVAPNPGKYIVRTPRHLDNVDSATAKNIEQQLNLDFATYRRYLENKDNTSMKIVESSTMPKDKSVVQIEYTGVYDGKNMFVKNVSVTETSAASTGLFAKLGITSQVSNMALLKSSFSGNAIVGSVAGINIGTIDRCEVSHTTVTSSGVGGTAGGVIGENQGGNISNVYVNSIHRDGGSYSSPVKGAKTGGIIGSNLRGRLTNAYTDAVGNNGFVTVGANTGTLTNVFFLKETGYNVSPVTTPNQGVGVSAIELGKKVADLGTQWESATLDNTLETVECRNLPYAFPKLKDINHYYDWPLLETYFKYYEEYSDGSIGYFYKLGKNSIDTLKYNPDITVTSEGYLIEMLSAGDYDVTFDGGAKKLSNVKTQIFDGKSVIKLAHSEVEPLITDAKINWAGIRPVRVTVSIAGNDTNILYGETKDGFVYFNPLFAKEIHLTQTAGAVPAVNKKFEVRSPRHMMSIDGYSTTEITREGEKIVESKPLLSAVNLKNLRSFEYNQTISLNFANGTVDGRAPYKKDGKTLGKMDKNVIRSWQLQSDNIAISVGEFTGSYDGSYTGVKNRIYNLTLNMTNGLKDAYGYSAAFANNCSTFGNLGDTGKISNLDFIDPQLRYTEKGMGGGMVANISYGEIRNISVSHTKPTQLFSDAYGSNKTKYCALAAANSNFVTSMQYDIFYHSHGGIVGVASGINSKVINCVVGTNSSNIQEIHDNNTRLSCNAPRRYSAEMFTLEGGIAGGITDNAQIIGCVNIATIEPVIDPIPGDYSDASVHCTAGIVGRIGNYISSQARDRVSRGEVIGSYNAGTVVARGSYIAGIAGRTQGIFKANNPSDVSAQNMSEIVSCYNTGRINVYNNSAGELVELQPNIRMPQRIGGIVGESDMTAIRNCYNIGYMSSKVPTEGTAGSVSSSGAILGLPTFTNNHIEYCYSLLANQFRPSTIVGDKYYDGAYINGTSDPIVLKALFENFWEPRASLRYNTVMTNVNYTGVDYPGLIPLTVPSYFYKIPDSGIRPYPVFNVTNDGFYIYPQLKEFTYKGVSYSNPHITPWEYIDAAYETTLKYYEKYEDDTVGNYYLDVMGNAVSTLKDDLIVKQDAYYLQIGAIGTYNVVINQKEFVGTATTDVLGLGTDVIGIAFTEEMKAALKADSYNSIRLFTQDSTIADDDKFNRMAGTNSIKGDYTNGIDVFFNPAFPSQIKLANANTDVDTLLPMTLEVRSPRHLANISILNGATTNLSVNRTFKQVLDMNFAIYADGIKSYATLDDSVVLGEFKGVYDGTKKDSNIAQISNLVIDDVLAPSENIGLFANNKGTITKIKITDAKVSSTSGNKLNMGIVAAQNEGTVKHLAVINPSVRGSALATEENLGGIVGTNGITNANALIRDVYLVAKDTAQDTPITTSSTGTSNLGGITGNNGGIIQRVLYLAKAPNINKPITGINTGSVADKPDTSVIPPIEPTVRYLAGDNYNDFDTTNVVGFPNSTKQLTQLRDNPIDWNDAWGESANYDYPSLMGITPPTTYPTAEPLKYFIAYYEEYKGLLGATEYGWYYYDNDGVLQNTLKDDALTIAKSAKYGVIVPAATDYNLSIDKGVAVPTTAIEVDGKFIVPLIDTALDATPMEVMINGYNMPSGYTYYNPLSAKAIYNTSGAFAPPNPVTFSIRTPEQMININVTAAMTNATYLQELDLDFASIPILSNSVVHEEFFGTYTGNAKSIRNVNIDALDIDGVTYLDNIGLFSLNSGVIDGMTLLPITNITGNNSVSGIAGTNQITGFIRNCSVRNGALLDLITITVKGVNDPLIAPENKGICGKNLNTDPRSLESNNSNITVLSQELPSATNSPLVSPSPIPSSSVSPKPSATSSGSPSATPSGSPSATPSSSPSATPSSSPSATPSSSSSATPSSSPSATPSSSSSATPSSSSSVTPSSSPSATSTVEVTSTIARTAASSSYWRLKVGA